MDTVLPEGFTFFAPAGRSSARELEAEIQACVEGSLGAGLLETLDAQVLVLNDHRQVLAVSPGLLEALDLEGVWNPHRGTRPGELLGCVHAQEGPEGCGTSEQCRQCGAVLAILAAQEKGQPSEDECLLSMRRKGQWSCGEFKVRCTPMTIGGHALIVLSLRDISAQKRREVLEHCFLHDLANSLQGLQGWAELLEYRLKDPQEVAQGILRLSQHLTAEVQGQRLLLQAEEGKLVLQPTTFALQDLFVELQAALTRHRVSQGRKLQLPSVVEDLALRSDRALVLRVIQNMAVNALEATEAGGTVSFAFETDLAGPSFSCHNPAFIPPEIAGRIFQRAFSTKASSGRGLGTYGMKLLGENFLKGRVGFSSHPEQGTTFSFHLPPSALVRLGH